MSHFTTGKLEIELVGICLLGIEGELMDCLSTSRLWVVFAVVAVNPLAFCVTILLPSPSFQLLNQKLRPLPANLFHNTSVGSTTPVDRNLATTI
jgi:hypothetical protein